MNLVNNKALETVWETGEIFMSVCIYLWRLMVGLGPVWPVGFHPHNPHAQLPARFPWEIGRRADISESQSERVLKRNISVTLICRNSSSLSIMSSPSTQIIVYFFGLIKCASQIAYVGFIITNNLLEKKSYFYKRFKKLFLVQKIHFWC